MKVVAVTGASGFVGKRFMDYNAERFQLRKLDLRNAAANILDVAGVDVIVHLAGKAHQMQQVDDRIYFEVNYELTKKLADHAKESGVRHFIFISSVKVYGDDERQWLDPGSPCIPTDAYGASKLKAEEYLQSIATESFKVAIIRPPLVYGPGVKGNMIRLLEMSSSKVPLPLGGIDNARSMVFVDNLLALVNAIIDKGITGVFIAGDTVPLSTTDLVLLIQQSLGNSKGLLRLPRFAKKIIGQLKPDFYRRLFGSFVIDNSQTNKELHYAAPYSTEYGIRKMTEWFKEMKQQRKKKNKRNGNL